MLEPTSGFSTELGITIAAVSDHRVMAHMLVKPEHLNSAGKAHGGVLMAFADEVAAFGTIKLLPSGSATTTIESKTNFLKAFALGRLTAQANALHIGRTTIVWQTTISAEDGRVLAVTTQTQLVMQLASAPAKTQGDAQTLEDVPAQELKCSTRQEKMGTRKQQILDAAFKVIANKGFAQAAMREIASTANVSVPTLYQYVRSKDELLEQIFNEYLDELQSKVNDLSLEQSSPSAKLRTAIEVTLREFDRFQSQIRLMNRETRSAIPEVRQRIKDHMLDYIGLFREIIQDGIAAGEFRPVNADMYANFISMLCEVWPLRMWAVGSYGAAEVGRGIADMTLRALCLDNNKN